MATITNTDAMLSVIEAACYLGLSPHTMNGWRYRGTGPPFHRLGSSVRYRREELETWLSAHRVDPKIVAHGAVRG